MECAELAEHLTDFLEGALDPDSEAAALEHLATCERCDAVLAQTRSVIDLAREHGRIGLEPGERDELLARILASEPPSD
jgi:anti-sigma factor RsiW